ncbi:MAG: ankyrin repeat domain-containing protein [Wolbachia endosymbiont of Xenopsylla cheopis]
MPYPYKVSPFTHFDQNVDKQSELLNAVYYGKAIVVEYLLKAGYDTNVKDQEGNTLLDIATQKGHTKIIELLTKNKIYIDSKDEDDYISLNSCQSEVISLPEITIELFSAAVDGDFEYVEYALELGVDVNTQNKYGSTPLFLSAYNGHAKIVEFLIKNGAKVNSINQNGETPLIAAALSGHLAVVEYLIKNGADVNIKGQYGNTALHLATYENHIKVVEVLIRNGANIDAKKQNGNLALHLAAYEGYIEVTKLLVESGTDIDATNQNGDTPLILAVQEGHLEVVKLLIKNGANVDIRDQEGNTILGLAVYNGHEEIVKFLIERKFDINVKKQNGCTALHTAAQIGDVKMMKLLIENGADINITNNDGCKPIHIAALSGQKEALEFLKSKNTGISDNNKLFCIIKYDDVLENLTKGYDELFEQSNGNTLNYIAPSHIFKIPFLVEIFKKNTKLTDLSKGICVLFANFISFLNFNKKEDFDELYDLINFNYRELNEENLKKFLEGKLEDRKTKEIFEFIQAIVKRFPILNTGNAVHCDNCDSLLPQELLARDILDNEYDMQFYRTVINKSAILRILKKLEKEDTILCIIAKITKDEIDHAISITKTYKGRYIFSDINKPNILEFSSEEEVCNVIELASNKYYKGLNCFPGIEFINSTKTVKKIIEHYAFKHKMYESENRPNYISSIDSTKKPKSQNKVSKNLTVLFMSLCAVSALALIVMCSVGHIDKLPKTFVGAVAGALFTIGVISMILWLQPSNKLDKAMLSHNQKKCL